MAKTWRPSGKKRRAPVDESTPFRRARHSFRDDAGRVHLLVQTAHGRPDIATGFSAPPFDEVWQNTMALSAANAVLRHCGSAPDVAEVVAVASEAMDALSKLALGLISQASPTVACSAGCDHCCHQSVGVTALEAITIVHHLRTTLDPATVTAVADHIRVTREQVRNLTREQRYAPEHPCVFLGQGGTCSIYPVRPLVCRAMNSLDANQCRDNLRDPDQRAAFLEKGHGPDALLGPFRASHALSAGLQLAGSDVYGWDTRPLDLVAAMDELLQNPEAVQQWLEGRDVFGSAVGSDASGNAHLRSLAGVTSTIG